MKKAVHLSGFYPIQQKSIYPKREQMLFLKNRLHKSGD